MKLKGENGGNKVNKSNEKHYGFELNDTVGNWLVEWIGIVLWKILDTWWIEGMILHDCGRGEMLERGEDGEKSKEQLGGCFGQSKAWKGWYICSG